MSNQPQPASATDHVFYFSESDDQPLSTHCPTDPDGVGSTMTEKDAHGPAPGMHISPSPPSLMSFTVILIDVGRIQRAGRPGRGKKMAEALEFEKADEHGNPDKRYTGTISRKPQKSKSKRPRFETDVAVTLGSSDEDDLDFECPEESDSDSESVSDSADILPSNAEVLHVVNLFLQVLMCCLH
jgi:hypothetical protein